MKNAFLILIIASTLFACKKNTSDVNSAGVPTPAAISWQKIGNKQFGTPGIKFLSVVNDNIFYYGYNTIVYKTINGGKTYPDSVKRDVNHSINNITVKSKDTVFVAHTQGVDCTFNGGLTWTPAYTGGAAIGDAKSVIFKNGSVGFIVASNGVFRTTHGGDAWQPTLLTEKYCYLSFVEDNTAYAIGEDGLVKKSIDGGSSWYPKTNYNGSTAVYATFINKNTGFINTGSALYVTRDGAETYTQIFYGEKVVDFKFISAKEGFLTTIDGTVHHTNDEGVTWEIDNDRLFIQYLTKGLNGQLYGSNDAVYKRF